MVYMPKSICDECQDILDECDKIYCNRCWDELIETIKELRERIDSLEEMNSSLEESIDNE